MNDQPLVSVIITTYKRKVDMVKRSVESVLNQTYKNIEVIVVDDSPETFDQRKNVEIQIKELRGDIKYIKHKVNKGACAARNTGIISSHGEYIAFLDDDDEWCSKKLEKQMNKFKEENVGWVYCGQYVIDETCGKTHIPSRQYYKGMVYDKLIIDNFIGSTSFVVLKKSVIEKAGFFDEEMKSAQDFDLWLRVSKISNIDYVDEPLVNYYIHDGECITFNPKNKIQGLESINKKNWDYIKNHKEAKWIRTIKLSPIYAWDGQVIKAFKTWIKAILIKPNKIKWNVIYLKRCIDYCIRYIKFV